MDSTQPTQTNDQPNTMSPPVVSPTLQKPSLNKMLLILVIILIIIIIFGGVILFLINQKKTSTKIKPQILPTESVKIITTITPIPTVVEINDPNDIDVGDIEADLKSIEKEIEDLQ